MLYLGLWNSPGGGGGQKEKLMCDRSLLIKHCLSNTDPTSIQREQKKTGRLEIPKYFRGLYKGDSDRVPNSLECLMELNLHQWRIVTQTVNGERYQRAREKKESIIGPNRICFPWLPSTSAQPLQSLGLSMCSVPPFTPFYFPKGSLHSFYFFPNNCIIVIITPTNSVSPVQLEAPAKDKCSSFVISHLPAQENTTT